jgi:hypothetical protein
MNTETNTETEDWLLDRAIEQARERRDIPTSADPYYAPPPAQGVPGANTATRPEGARHV